MAGQRSVKRIVVPTQEEDSDGWKLAIAYADKIAGNSAIGINQVVLFVASKAQLKNTSFLNFVGHRAAKTLHDNGQVTLPCGVAMSAQTLATLRAARNGTLMLVFWADANMMAKVDALSGVSAVVAYPWLEEGIDSWIKTWNPAIHGSNEPAQEDALINDPVIVSALSSLTTSVNLSNTGLHGHYADITERTLRVLRAKDHALDPDAIKLWAIRHKWHPNMATDLHKKAKKIAELKKKPSLRSLEHGAETYAYWLTKTAPHT